MLLGALLAITAIVTGCGDDSDAENGSGDSGDSTTVASSSLSKKEFVKQANKICYGEKEKQLAELNVYLKNNNKAKRNDAGTEAVSEILVPSVQQSIEGVRELGAPKGEEAEIEAMLVDLEKANGEIEDKGVSSSAGIRRVYKPAGQPLYDYGLTGCAYGF
jgi:hypothetical protein